MDKDSTKESTSNNNNTNLAGALPLVLPLLPYIIPGVAPAVAAVLCDPLTWLVLLPLTLDGDAGSAQRSVMQEETESPKEIQVSKGEYPEAAKNIEDAQAAGHPEVVTVDREGSRERRKQALKGTKAEAGKDRDEYPPAVSKEGGAGSQVRTINPADNRGAGASMGNQIRKVPNGGRIKIKVVK
jgi:hypothetical protein